MHDPHFEATVADIRGFDLGDGVSLLAELDALMEEGLTGAQWLLRAVLLHREERDEEALDALDEAIERGASPSRALYLKSCLLRDLERAGEALEALREAKEAAVDDGLMTIAELDHAQGLLFWRVGSHEDALAQIDHAIELDPGSAGRWLHRGQILAALGRADEAAAAFDRALLEEQDLDRAMYERAVVESGRGESEAAAAWLTKAVHLQPKHRARALEDIRFAGVREQEALVELLTARRPADLGWLDEISTWMPALRRDPELPEKVGLTWLGEAESETLRQGLLAEHERGPVGTMHTGATLEYSRELLKTRRPIARAPMGLTRERVEDPCVLFVDEARPQDGLWLALSASYPPFLWIRIEPRAHSVVRALQEFVPRPTLSRIDLPQNVRGFVGYRSRFVVPSPMTGELEPATVVELDRHFAINPFVESASWGSAFVDDPWPAEIPEQPDLTHKIAARQRLVAEQAPGHTWSITRRTRHSRSYLSIEVHHDEIFVIDIRYRPNAHPEVVDAMNEHFGCDYPRDLPIDVVAALLGFQFDRADDLQQVFDPNEPETLAGLLYVFSALRHRDPGVMSVYRSLLDHPDPVVRNTIGDIAEVYNYEALLEEMSLREPDPEIQAELEALLDEGIPAPHNDPYAAASHFDADVADAGQSGVRPSDSDQEPWELSATDLVLDEELVTSGEVSP